MSLDINLTGVEKTSNKKTTLTDNSDTFYPTQKAVKTAVDLKVDAVAGKGLSANDFTNTLKTKLDGIQAGAEVNVNADWNATSGDSQILNKPTIPDTSDFVAKSDFTSHSILAKQSGASDPVAVSIGNNEILGRKSGGGSNIEGLSVSEVKSLLGYTASDVGAVATNSAITGATKTKITYDSKGLVTSGADATTADIADSSNKRYVTDANLTVIGNTSNTNTGDETQSSIFSKLKLSIKKGIGYAPVTGTTLETLVGTLSFDANAFETSDNLRIIANCQRSGTTATAAIMRVKVNSVNDFATATTIATISTTNSAQNNFGLIRESFIISGGNLTGYPFATSALTDNALLALTLGSVAVDVTQPLYFFVSLANANTTESNVVRTFKISNI
jgi:hypothetical protein